MTRQELYNKLNTSTVANVTANDLFDEARLHAPGGNSQWTLVKAIATVLFHARDADAELTDFIDIYTEVEEIVMTNGS